MNLPKYCFDTHVLVWFFRKSKTLSGKAKSILEEAFLGKSISFIPSIVLLEAFRLSLKDPEFIFPKFLEFLSNAQFIIVPLEEDVLKICFGLPKEVNIHDRVVIATAISTDSKLITKDKILRSFFPNETIW